MAKTMATISVDSEILAKARKYNIPISATCEAALLSEVSKYEKTAPAPSSIDKNTIVIPPAADLEYLKREYKELADSYLKGLFLNTLKEKGYNEDQINYIKS